MLLVPATEAASLRKGGHPYRFDCMYVFSADKEVGSRRLCRSYAYRASSAQPAHASRFHCTEVS